jgi:hypothetical protein
MSTSLNPIILKETAAPSNPPTGHVALYSVDGSALLMKDEAGVVTTLGGGTTISAMSAASALTGAETIPAVQGGSNVKVTASQLNAFVDPASNSSTAAQTLGTGDTYLAGSDPTAFAAGRLKAASFYRCIFDMTKTAAGVAIATMTLRMGTLGTTGDAAICVFTFPSAQTAAVDNARFMVTANLRSVGAGTAAVVQGTLYIERTNTTTGFLSTSGLQFMAPIRVVSSGFNSTTVTKIGLSVNAGASSAWTTQSVQSDIKNLS